MKGAAIFLGLVATAALGWMLRPSPAPLEASQGASAPVSPPKLSASEQLDLGRRIYREGRGQDPSSAAFPGSKTRVPASVLPCANCHGEAGVGEPEGGIFPAEITWHALTKSYGVKLGGRERGPYTAEGVVWAVTQGVDPSGNQLDPAMPRYAFSQRDMAALLAYLQQLDEVREAGVTEASVAIEVLLPEGEAWAGLARELRVALDWAAARFEGDGRLFGRRFELHYRAVPEDEGPGRKVLRAIAEDSKCLLVLAPWLPGREAWLESELGARGVPVLLGAAADDSPGQLLDATLFALLSSPRTQRQALATFAADSRGSLGVLGAAALRDPLCDQLAGLGLERPQAVDSLDAALAAGLGGLLILEGESSQLRLGAERPAMGLASPPVLYALGATWSPDLGRAAQGLGSPVVLALPKRPGSAERSPWVQGLAEDGLHSKEHAGAQELALGTLALAAEGLRLCGASPTRKLLVECIEGLYAWDCGLVPPLTFDRNRRVGARGACLVELRPGEAGLHVLRAWSDPEQR